MVSDIEYDGRLGQGLNPKTATLEQCELALRSMHSVKNMNIKVHRTQGGDFIPSAANDGAACVTMRAENMNVSQNEKAGFFLGRLVGSADRLPMVKANDSLDVEFRSVEHLAETINALAKKMQKDAPYQHQGLNTTLSLIPDEPQRSM